jgi:hypothetical protein
VTFQQKSTNSSGVMQLALKERAEGGSGGFFLHAMDWCYPAVSSTRQRKLLFGFSAMWKSLKYEIKMVRKMRFPGVLCAQGKCKRIHRHKANGR